MFAIGGAIFDPSRSIFDPVLGVKGQIFAKSAIFNSALVYFENYKSQQHKTFTSVYLVQFCTILCIVITFIDGIFAARSVPEGNSVTPIGKIA